MADRRRITGPETASPLVFATNEKQLAPKGVPQKKEPIRPFYAKQGVIENANGSCYLEIGQTAVVVSVFGAKPIRGSLLTSAKFTVSCKMGGNMADAQQEEIEDDKLVATEQIGRSQLSSVEQRISSYIYTAFLPSILLEKYPKSSIEVFVNILTNDVHTNNHELSLVTWCSNCVSLALVDAGIELVDMVCTGDAKMAADGPEMDPLFGEKGSEGQLCAVASYMCTTGVLVGMAVEGGDVDGMEDVLKETENMARQVRGALLKVVDENVTEA